MVIWSQNDRFYPSRHFKSGIYPNVGCEVDRRFAGDNPSNSQGCPEVCRRQPSVKVARFAENYHSNLEVVPKFAENNDPNLKRMLEVCRDKSQNHQSSQIFDVFDSFDGFYL